MTKLISLFLLTLGVVSCKTPNQYSPTAFFIDRIDSNRIDDVIKQKLQQLHFTSLENGFDSIQLRIWYDRSLRKERDLLILKCTKEQWEAFHYNMLVDWNSFNLTETILTTTYKTVRPKHGWDNLLSNLSKLEIHTLPNMEDIPGLKDGFEDGNSYTVEIAIGKKYRTYSYHVPQEFMHEYWQAKNMVAILTLLADEFNIVN